MKNACMFEKIIGYNPSIPTCHLSPSIRIKWALLFLYNFIFRINQTHNVEEIATKAKNYTNDSNSSKKLQNKILNEFRIKNTSVVENTLPLPEVNSEILSKKQFAEWRTKINMPIVFRGLIKNSFACQNWSIEWLIENFGDEVVHCIPPEISSLLGEEVKLEKISLKDFCAKKEYHNYYINNHHSIFENKDFYESCNGKKIEDLRGARHLIDQWFISRSNQTGSSLHCANGDNIFLNIKGRKEWHFIHPSYTPLLSPILSKYGMYAVAGVEKSLLNKWDSIREIFPYFKFIPVYKVVLQEGDVLFNPPWWWHSVRNLDGFTLGCATRYLAPGKASNIAVFHIGQIVEAIRHPIKSIYPQTLYMLLFKRVNKKLLNSIFSKK